MLLFEQGNLPVISRLSIQPFVIEGLGLIPGSLSQYTHGRALDNFLDQGSKCLPSIS